MIISFRCKSTREASLSFLEVPVAQRVGRIPADADQDHIDRKAHPFEVEHINSSRVRAPKFTRLASRLSLMRQNPLIAFNPAFALGQSRPAAISAALLACPHP